MNQFINFISSDKGYIIVVLIILVVAFFVSKKNLYDEENKSGSSLKITLTMFILFMIGVAGYIIVFGENITDANKLSTIASFTAPFIAFSGAYLIFEFGQKKADEEKKLENVKKLEYKKLMLFTLLDYTVHKTENLYEDLNKCYKGAYSGGLKNDLPVIKGYENEVIGELENDVPRIHTLRGSSNNVKGFASSLKVLFNDKFLRDVHLNEFIYDNNWTSYLDCIPNLRDEHKIRDIQRITNWLIALQEYKAEGYNRKQIDPIDFILMRRGIKGLIDELAPDIKKNGFRG